MATLYRHRIYCISEAAWAYLWKESAEPLAACPNDPAHETQDGSAIIVDQMSPNDVAIRMENAPATGGHVATDHVVVEAPASSAVTVGKSWPYPVALYFMRLIVPADCLGCFFTADLGGGGAATVTADAPAGTTVLKIDMKAAVGLALGLAVTIAQSGESKAPEAAAAAPPTEELGRLVAIDPAASTITVSVATVADYMLANGPVSVVATERVCDQLELGIQGALTIGEDRFRTVPFGVGRRVSLTLTNPTEAPARLLVYLSHAY